MKNKTPEKARLHARNKNRERYDLDALVKAIPALTSHVKPNKFGVDSLDFSNSVAVKLLNKALLHHYYGIENWDFPDENLCPPIPGRADYIHHIADLLSENDFGNIPTGDKITCLDIGVGASCIYPILGVTEYDWNFIGTDIESKSIESAQRIVEANPTLHNKIECKLQENPKDLFYGIISKEDKIDITICNPPFHASTEEAHKGSHRKVNNLKKEKTEEVELNFSGISHELIYEGGEHQFIHKMIKESRRFSRNCFWFSTLVSKQSNLKGIYKALHLLEVKQIRTIPMGTSNKSSRIVAWTFLSKTKQKDWRDYRWHAKSTEESGEQVEVTEQVETVENVATEQVETVEQIETIEQEVATENVETVEQVKPDSTS